MAESESGELADLLLSACQSGDAHALQSLLGSVTEADLVSLATEDGVTLLMHTIIGAGMYFLTRHALLNQPRPIVLDVDVTMINKVVRTIYVYAKFNGNQSSKR